MSEAPGPAIMWFRKGLRLHDNPALLDAAAAPHLYPVFVCDPHFYSPDRVGVNRIAFLIECLEDLDASLRARGSRLLVLRGRPAEVLPAAARAWRAARLCYEADTEPYALARDAEVGGLVRAAGVAVAPHVSHTLYDLDALLARAGGRPPLTMRAFEKLLAGAGPPRAPAADPPARLPPPAPGAWACGAGESRVFSLADVGYGGGPPPTKLLRGGEGAALAALAEHVARKDWVAGFEKPKTNPAALPPRVATTALSPHLKFGSLSARLFYAQVAAVLAERKGRHTLPPVSLHGQLLWREFFYLCGRGIPNFGRQAGNPTCKQVPWEPDAARLAAWEAGRTGYPWIDAIQAQLRREGWMHHLARHSVACFLTRGDLWQPWEAGRDVFDKYLLDADWAINTGNWQWLSATAFFSQFFRVYSPVAFGKQYDKDGAFIRHYLPVLKDMPAKYIYEPWTAPAAVQEKAGCVVGKDYPAPIVDHAAAVKVNMEKMKAAYAAAREAGGGDEGGGDEGEGAGAGGSGGGRPAAAAAPKAKRAKK